MTTLLELKHLQRVPDWLFWVSPSPSNFVALVECGDTMTPLGMNTPVARAAGLRLGWSPILDRD